MPKAEELPPHEQYIVDVLLNCAPGGTISKNRENVTATPGGVQPCAAGQKGVPLVVPVLLSTIEGISHIRLFLPKDLRPDQARETVWKSVLEVQRRFPDGVALLDPILNMNIKDDKFKQLVKVVFTFDKWFVQIMTKSTRKSRPWKKKCSRALFTRTHGYQSCTPCIRRRKKRTSASEDSRSASKQPTTCCSSKS